MFVNALTRQKTYGLVWSEECSPQTGKVADVWSWGRMQVEARVFPTNHQSHKTDYSKCRCADVLSMHRVRASRLDLLDPTGTQGELWCVNPNPLLLAVGGGASQEGRKAMSERSLCGGWRASWTARTSPAPQCSSRSPPPASMHPASARCASLPCTLRPAMASRALCSFLQFVYVQRAVCCCPASHVPTNPPISCFCSY